MHRLRLWVRHKKFMLRSTRYCSHVGGIKQNKKQMYKGVGIMCLQQGRTFRDVVLYTFVTMQQERSFIWPLVMQVISLRYRVLFSRESVGKTEKYIYIMYIFYITWKAF